MLKITAIAFVSLASSALPISSAIAQDPQIRVRSLERPAVMAYTMSKADRPLIGVSLSVGAPGDTLGLQVEQVTADGPAAKAGITVGSRLQEINGVSLRISADDAADPLTADAGYRRLQRELGKLKVGDEVTLRVLNGGQTRSVSVTTTSAQQLDGTMTTRVRAPLALMREERSNRAALGISIGSAGNARDTLGLFISAVVSDGPAEKAGIIEGDRIAAINGVDVRVPREDARDGAAASARLSRFMREVEKASPGDKLKLRVVTNGRYREVEVTAAKASEVPGAAFMFQSGDMNVNLRRATERVRVQPDQMAPPSGPPAPTVRPTSPTPSAPPARAVPARIRTVRVNF